jgi:hypothetical protein
MDDVGAGRERVFCLYVSARYLQELAVALGLIGVESWYARPGIGGVLMPRLYVKFPVVGWVDDCVCASREFSDAGGSDWWFIRVSHAGSSRRICRPVDMARAARLVAEELGSELWVDRWVW